MDTKADKQSDYELIIRIKTGDEDSFKELFLRYYPRFRYFILRFVSDADYGYENEASNGVNVGRR